MQTRTTATARITASLRRAGTRLRREQRGQTAAEYLGIIVLVAAVVVALVGASGGIPTTIKDAIEQKISDITDAGFD